MNNYLKKITKKLVRISLVSSLFVPSLYSCKSNDVSPSVTPLAYGSKLPKVENGRLVFENKEQFNDLMSTLEKQQVPDLWKGLRSLDYVSLEKQGTLKDSVLSFPNVYKSLLNTDYEYEIADTVYHYDLKEHMKYVIPKNQSNILEELKKGNHPSNAIKLPFGYAPITSSKQSGARVEITPDIFQNTSTLKSTLYRTIPIVYPQAGQEILIPLIPGGSLYRTIVRRAKDELASFVDIEMVNAGQIYYFYRTRLYLRFAIEEKINNNWQTIALGVDNYNISVDSEVIANVPTSAWASPSNKVNYSLQYQYHLLLDNHQSEILLQEFAYLGRQASNSHTVYHKHKVEITGTITNIIGQNSSGNPVYKSRSGVLY